jgi:glycylpeptide N-tetradecanoyltransferase
MAENSKPVDPKLADEDPKGKGKAVAIESEDEDEVADDDEPASAGTTATGASKKKKSKRKKIKDALTGKSKDDKDVQLLKAIDSLTPDQISQFLELNPALANEIARTSGGNDIGAATQALKQLKLQEIMTGLASSGKNVKDMGAYKFWSTQPVPKFGEESGDKAKFEDGPIKVQTVDEVPKEPSSLITGFEWCTVDLLDAEQLKEVQELLQGHYVEDDDASFRFNYSASLLKW